MVAAAAEGRDREELRRLAARRGDRADRPLEARDALLERGDRRVRDTAVDRAVLLQGEEVGGVRGVLEHEAGGLVHRHGPGARAGIRRRPCVDRTRPEPPSTILAHDPHRIPATSGDAATSPSGRSRPRSTSRSAPARTTVISSPRPRGSPPSPTAASASPPNSPAARPSGSATSPRTPSSRATSAAS